MFIKRGYTLLEIIIVVGILAILFSIGLPNIKYFADFKEKRELNEFRRDLLFARNQAIVESANYTVRFDIDRNTYYITSGKRNETIRSKTFREGIRFDANNHIRSFVFNYNGTSSNSGTLYLRDSKNNRYELTLSPVTSRMELKLSNFK